MWRALLQEIIYTYVILYYEIFKRQAHNIVGDKNSLCILFLKGKVKINWGKKKIIVVKKKY